jgi:hypothetical protein
MSLGGSIVVRSERGGRGGCLFRVDVFSSWKELVFLLKIVKNSQSYMQQHRIVVK